MAPLCKDTPGVARTVFSWPCVQRYVKQQAKGEGSLPCVVYTGEYKASKKEHLRVIRLSNYDQP